MIFRVAKAFGLRRHFCNYADKDLYKILGVTKNSSKKDIKTAYASLVKQHHPDVKKGDDTMFKDINLAYSILSNDEKKSAYDQYADQKSRLKDFQGGGQTFRGVDFVLQVFVSVRRPIHRFPKR